MKKIFCKASFVIMVFALALSGCSDPNIKLGPGLGPIPQPPLESFTVTFDGSGGTPGLTTATVNAGESVTQPTDPTLSDWTFVGWFTHQTAGVSPFNFNIAIWQDITLWARWSQNPRRVTFDLQGGTWNRENHVYVDVGNEVPRLADPTHVGNFVFAGWFEDPTDKNTQWDFSTLVTDPITLYAHWDPYVRVTFQAHLESAYVYIPPRTAVSRPADDPTRVSYIFTNWFNAATAGELWNFAAPIDQDTTIYAQWRDYAIVTFGEAGGITPAPQNVTIGQSAVKPTDPFVAPVGAAHGLFNAAAGNQEPSWNWTLYWYFEGSRWDFSDPVTHDKHLAGNWRTPYGPINLAGQPGHNIIHQSFAHVRANPGDYFMFLGHSLTLPAAWTGPGAETTGTGDRLTGNSRLTLIGLDEERVIRRPGAATHGFPYAYFGTLFSIEGGAELILGKNITLGTVNNNFGKNPLVLVMANGALTMRDGSRITGHRLTNTSQYQWIQGTSSAIVVWNNATFTMTGGEISGNSSAAPWVDGSSALHVLPGSTINLQGGRIINNRTNPAGGITARNAIKLSTGTPAINFTISGDAEIEDLVIMRSGLIAVRHTITVAENWTGSINRLNLLSSGVPDMNAADALWDDTFIFEPVSGQNLPAGLPGKITTNYFYTLLRVWSDTAGGYVNQPQPDMHIANTHVIANDGRLVLGSGGGGRSGAVIPAARNADNVFGVFMPSALD